MLFWDCLVNNNNSSCHHCNKPARNYFLTNENIAFAKVPFQCEIRFWITFMDIKTEAYIFSWLENNVEDHSDVWTHLHTNARTYKYTHTHTRGQTGEDTSNIVFIHFFLSKLTSTSQKPPNNASLLRWKDVSLTVINKSVHSSVGQCTREKYINIISADVLHLLFLQRINCFH